MGILPIGEGIMDFQITLRHMENSPEIDLHIRKQMGRILEFLKNEPTPVYIHLVASPSKNHAHHQVELIIKTPHYNLVGKDEGPIFFVILDQVIDTMYKTLGQEKRKVVDGHKEKKRMGKPRL